MKKSSLTILSLVIFTFLLIPFSQAYDVDVGLYIVNLGKFDVSTGSFTADFYLYLKCDEANCSTGNFEFMNGRATSTDKIMDTKSEKFYRIQAGFTSPVDLKEFPFDSQKMQIVIEDKENPIEMINYVPDDSQSGLDEAIFFTGWKILGWNSNTTKHYYKPYDETYSTYTLNIDISRIKFNAFFKTFLPIFFIMLITIFTFVIDPDKIMNRLTIAGSSLVASVMFHISISNQIPPVGYMTMADKFMILTYMILLVTFIINITLLEMQELKKTHLVERVNKITEYNMLWIVPAAYIIFFLIVA